MTTQNRCDACGWASDDLEPLACPVCGTPTDLVCYDPNAPTAAELLALQDALGRARARRVGSLADQLAYDDWADELDDLYADVAHGRALYLARA